MTQCCVPLVYTEEFDFGAHPLSHGNTLACRIGLSNGLLTENGGALVHG